MRLSNKIHAPKEYLHTVRYRAREVGAKQCFRVCLSVRLLVSLSIYLFVCLFNYVHMRGTEAKHTQGERGI